MYKFQTLIIRLLLHIPANTEQFVYVSLVLNIGISCING